jgi:pyridoxamine 5'-phosphate oxidase
VDPDRLAALRAEYRRSGLAEADVAADPIAQFAGWLVEAVEVGLPEPNAVVVATVGADARPSGRHVLLREYDERGFVFYTNLTSRKATEIRANAGVCLVFPWFPMQRQVIVIGTAGEISRAEAAAYFATRPRGAQLGAWASTQSAVIPGREWLDERVADAAARFPDDVPLPDFWGGFRVTPETVEFWQGREDRLHDRLRYRRDGERWLVERLSP